MSGLEIREIYNQPNDCNMIIRHNCKTTLYENTQEGSNLTSQVRNTKAVLKVDGCYFHGRKTEQTLFGSMKPVHTHSTEGK